MALRYGNWKVHFVWQVRMDDAPQRGVVKLFDLYVSPQERLDESLPMAFQHGWGESSVPRYYGLIGRLQALMPNVFARVLGASRRE